MSIINIYNTVPQALHQWERWAMSDSPAKTVAGFPKESLTEAVRNFHLLEQSKTNTFRRAMQFASTRQTVKGKQSKIAKRMTTESHPVAEAVESAIVRMREVQPKLYHALLADRLCIVPVYLSGIDKRHQAPPHHYEYRQRRWAEGERETEHKQRMAGWLSMSLAQFYQLCEAYQLYVGTWLDLQDRYEIVEEPVVSRKSMA